MATESTVRTALETISSPPDVLVEAGFLPDPKETSFDRPTVYYSRVRTETIYATDWTPLRFHVGFQIEYIASRNQDYEALGDAIFEAMKGVGLLVNWHRWGRKDVQGHGIQWWEVYEGYTPPS